MLYMCCTVKYLSDYLCQDCAYVDNSAAIKKEAYEDKASIRRETVGSDHPYQKDDLPASVNTYVLFIVKDVTEWFKLTFGLAVCLNYKTLIDPMQFYTSGSIHSVKINFF